MADITTPKVASICANHYGTDPFNQQQQSQEPDPWASRQPAPPSDGFDADPEF